MIILFHFAAVNGFQTILEVQGLLELSSAVGTVAATLYKHACCSTFHGIHNSVSDSRMWKKSQKYKIFQN
jgi:hypothetical protein